MKKSILMSALLLCIAPSVFGQEDELKTATERKENKKQRYINKEETERIRKEEERIREEKEEKENAKDIPHIKNYIKEGFLKWTKKGEFESSKKHFERIQNKGLEVLYEIVDKGFRERTSYRRIEIDLGTYNADEKIYPITITQSYEDYELRVKANVYFRTGEEAITFKKAIEKEKYGYRFSEINPDNWFVQDGFLFPINVEYSLYFFMGEDTTSKKILNKGDNPLFSEYVFNTDDLGLSEYFPENYTFTLKSLEK